MADVNAKYRSHFALLRFICVPSLTEVLGDDRSSEVVELLPADMLGFLMWLTPNFPSSFLSTAVDMFVAAVSW